MMEVRAVVVCIVLLVSGCGLVCPDPPEMALRLTQDRPLPFRVSGVSVRTEDMTGGGTCDARELAAVQELTNLALFAPVSTNPDADAVVTVVVDIRELRRGTSALFRSPDTAVKYEADMYVFDIASGDILFWKRYAEIREWTRRADISCRPWPEEVKALYSAINGVNDRFLADLHTVSGRSGASEAPGRIRGALGTVSVRFADNFSVGNWRYKHRGGGSFLLRIQSGLQSGVSVALVQGPYFSLDKGDLYEVVITIDDLDEYGEGLFHRGRDVYFGTAVITRNGTEIGRVELREADVPEKVTVSALNAVFVGKICQFFEALQDK
jgi:hypothetical protein